MLGGKRNKPTHAHAHTHTHTHTRCTLARRPGKVPRSQPRRRASGRKQLQHQILKPTSRNPSVFSPLSVSPFLPLSLHPSLFPSLPPPTPLDLFISLSVKIQSQWATGILTLFIHTTGGHGAQSLDDVGLHVFTFERVPTHLLQPFNSDVRNSVTGRVKVLAYWLAAVVADVGQMLGKVNQSHQRRSFCLTDR